MTQSFPQAVRPPWPLKTRSWDLSPDRPEHLTQEQVFPQEAHPPRQKGKAHGGPMDGERFVGCSGRVLGGHYHTVGAPSKVETTGLPPILRSKLVHESSQLPDGTSRKK